MLRRDDLVRPVLSTFDGKELPLDTERVYRVMGYHEERDLVFVVDDEFILREYPGQLFVAEPEAIVRAVEQLFRVLDNEPLGTIRGNNKLTAVYRELRAFVQPVASASFE